MPVTNATTRLSPPGTIAAFGGAAAPAGWLECNGAIVPRVTYAALFAAIGTTWGPGDGFATFALPDLRGEFLRGADKGRGVDAGRVFGSSQAESFKEHSHLQNENSSVYAETLPQVQGSEVGPIALGLRGQTDAGTVSNRQGVYTSNAGSNETRPRNVAVIYCIKT